MAIMRARPKPGLGAEPTSNVGDWLCEFVWAYRVRGELAVAHAYDEQGVLFASTTGQMSGRVHACHRQFSLDGILLDVGGGGNLIMTELSKSRQPINGVEVECNPIACVDDMTCGADAQLILNMFRRNDSGISQLWPLLRGDDSLAEAMHVVFQEAVEHGIVSFPMPFQERPASTTKDWDREKRWALINLDEARRQMMNIHAAMNDDGTYALTRNGAKQFSAVGKKDLAYACIMAYVRFLLWLKVGNFQTAQSDEDSVGISEVK